MVAQALSIAVLTAALSMLAALGFTLIFGVMRIVNFAHGEFLMLGAYGLYVAMQVAGLPFGAALPLVALGVGFVGIVAERLLFRRFVGDELGGMIVSLALAVSLQGAVTSLFGVDDLAVDRPFSGTVAVAGVTMAWDQIVTALIALAMVGATYVVLVRTKFGLAIRAVAQDATVARLQGISPRRIYPLAFGLGALLAGAAGALTAPLYTIQPFMGEAALLKAFIVVVLGGLGSIPGAALAALILSLIEAFVSIWGSATLATLVSFVAVLGLLLIRPAGLLGRAA